MTNEVLDAPEPSMASLAGGIVNDAQTLIKQELALAKREVADELIKGKTALMTLGTSIGIGLVGAVLLGFMLVYFLHGVWSELLSLGACHGIVGAALVILGRGLFLLGKKRARAVNLMPEQTIATMKDNFQWIKNQT